MAKITFTTLVVLFAVLCSFCSNGYFIDNAVPPAPHDTVEDVNDLIADFLFDDETNGMSELSQRILRDGIPVKFGRKRSEIGNTRRALSRLVKLIHAINKRANQKR